MQQPSSPSAAAPIAPDADRGAFTRFIPWDEETRLYRVRDALQGLRDLCVTNPPGHEIVKVSQIGYLIELAVRDLNQLALGERGGVPCLLGEPS